ncbi:hypothetical protein ACFLQ2_02755 [archaeon]
MDTDVDWLAAWCHFPVPLGPILPLAVWLTKKDTRAGLEARQAFYWQMITAGVLTTVFSAALVISSLSMLLSLGGGLLLEGIEEGGLALLFMFSWILFAGAVNLISTAIVFVGGPLALVYQVYMAYHSITNKPVNYFFIAKQFEEGNTRRLNILLGASVLAIIGFAAFVVYSLTLG